MKVPLFSPLAQNEALASALHEVFKSVLDSGIFILGSEVEVFEKEFAAWHGMNESVAISSGTDALLVALMAAGVGPGDEVIVPSFTFFATAGVVSRLGARPVFADVCPACYLMQPDDVEHLIVPGKTKAVIPVHLFGHAMDMNAMEELGKRYGVVIVEDVAQAMGARCGEQRVGTRGDFGCFSFFPTKNLGGFGDGGMVLARRAEDADRVRRLRNHGMHPKYHHAEVGGNFRLDALQCALLRVKLPHVEHYLECRAQHAGEYLRRLRELPGVSVESSPTCNTCACGKGGRAEKTDARLVLPEVRRGQTPAWNQFTVRVPHGQRDALKQWLLEHGVGSEIYYPVPLHQQTCFSVQQPASSLPHTELLCQEVLSLPVYPEMTPNQRDHVIETLNAWLTR
ncbi:MAG: DegT/DnrJ/EryC1/StrS family aminotransferase [Candidatus Methylacidiphilales bacterium]